VRDPFASPMAVVFSALEAIERFPCFGGRCAALVIGSGPAGTPHAAALRVKHGLLAWHDQFSRFQPDSELSRLNRDPRQTVAVSPAMTRFVEAALNAAAMTGVLVDPALAGEMDRAGYAKHLDSVPVPLRRALALTPRRAPGGPNPTGAWRQVRVDRSAGTVTRLVRGAVATSGIGKRSWLDSDGRPAHHLLDPATGRPAFTGVVQVTAFAPTGVQAEALSKAALLSGPDRAAGQLNYGGVVVYEDETFEVIDPHGLA
jgi:FAD:protein FMN transferase